MPSRHAMPVGTVAKGAVLAVDLGGTDEDGVSWLFVRQVPPEPGDTPMLAGWIRQDRTEAAAGE